MRNRMSGGDWAACIFYLLAMLSIVTFQWLLAVVLGMIAMALSTLDGEDGVN